MFPVLDLVEADLERAGVGFACDIWDHDAETVRRSELTRTYLLPPAVFREQFDRWTTTGFQPELRLGDQAKDDEKSGWRLTDVPVPAGTLCVERLRDGTTWRPGLGFTLDLSSLLHSKDYNEGSPKAFLRPSSIGSWYERHSLASLLARRFDIVVFVEADKIRTEELELAACVNARGLACFFVPGFVQGFVPGFVPGFVSTPDLFEPQLRLVDSQKHGVCALRLQAQLENHQGPYVRAGRQRQLQVDHMHLVQEYAAVCSRVGGGLTVTAGGLATVVATLGLHVCSFGDYPHGSRFGRAKPETQFPDYLPVEVCEGVFLGGLPHVHPVVFTALNVDGVFSAGAPERTRDLRDLCPEIEFLCVPGLKDNGLMSALEAIELGVAWICEQRAKGKRVLVHCHRGISRSVTVVAAYLIRTFKMSAAEALALIRGLRPGVDPTARFRLDLEIVEFEALGRRVSHVF